MAAPKRELFRAAEVCALAQVQPYVLRSWEAEFPELGQCSTDGGPRVYRRADVELVLQIKQLVFGEGLTLAGARRRLEEARQGDAPVAPVAVEQALGVAVRDRLRAIAQGLRAILDLLDRRREPGAPDFQVVAPPARPQRRAAVRAGRAASARAGVTKRRRASA